MWKAKTAFHISHSHDGGLGIYPMLKTETETWCKWKSIKSVFEQLFRKDANWVPGRLPRLLNNAKVSCLSSVQASYRSYHAGLDTFPCRPGCGGLNKSQ